MLLVFTGNPGRVTNGTGVYQGASGRVVSTKDIAGSEDSDIVAIIRLHGESHG